MVNKKLQKELLEMMKLDVNMRNSIMTNNINNIYDPSLDKNNTARMKDIIREYGWPGYELVGKKGDTAAWLLVQHADHDPAFQKECLGLLEKTVSEGQADKRNLAYLTDRVLVNTGKKQLYGTQFYYDKNGVYCPRPIEDHDQLEERRKSAGLEPFTKYEKLMRAVEKKFKKHQ